MFSDDVEGLSDVDTCDEELEPVENTCINLHAHKIKLLITSQFYIKYNKRIPRM